MTLNPGFAVAIDGPVGVGKSTVALRLANALNMTYIDTGAMYRAVALYNMRLENDPEDEAAITETLPYIDIQLAPEGIIILNGEDITGEIRNQALAEYTSAIAVYAAVREKLSHQQQAIAASGCVVMDGRDIGSQVLPWAQVKIYLDADVRVRAKRRQRELRAKGLPADFTQIYEETLIRDKRDTTRKHSPLVRAKDAIFIDTSYMSPDELLAEMIRIVKKAQ